MSFRARQASHPRHLQDRWISGAPRTVVPGPPAQDRAGWPSEVENGGKAMTTCSSLELFSFLGSIVTTGFAAVAIINAVKARKFYEQLARKIREPDTLAIVEDAQ